MHHYGLFSYKLACSYRTGQKFLFSFTSERNMRSCPKSTPPSLLIQWLKAAESLTR